MKNLNNISKQSILDENGKKQEKYELIITANDVTSSDDRFTMNNLALGDNYKPLDVYFNKNSGEEIKRKYSKGEKKISNQTMPKLAFQIFEKQIKELSQDEKKSFPICQYTLNSEIYRGIYTSLEELKEYRKSFGYINYSYDGEKQFFIGYWNIFSTIMFVQECLKRFGQEGDKFVLVYHEEEDKEDDKSDINKIDNKESKEYLNKYSQMLIESKNIILRGAPGTGKSYLAKEIAADIISNGSIKDYTQLKDDQKKQIEFVQFHPSYDYTDFVEGLRPKLNDDGSMGFELQDGIFKRFVSKAKKNFDDSQKSQEVIDKEVSVQEMISEFF